MCTLTPRQAVRRTVGYDRRNQPYMRDDEDRAHGWPMGTGVVEGACRHLVNDRREPAGMRWTTGGAQGGSTCGRCGSMAIGLGTGSFIGTTHIGGCMATPPPRQHWQKPERWSGRPDQPAVHEFWSHSYVLRINAGCLAWLSKSARWRIFSKEYVVEWNIHVLRRLDGRGSFGGATTPLC